MNLIRFLFNGALSDFLAKDWYQLKKKASNTPLVVKKFKVIFLQILPT